MKKILVDTYKTIDLHSGLGQFSLNFAKQLLSQKPTELEITFLLPKNVNPNCISQSSVVHSIKSDFQKRYFPFLNTSYTIWHSLYQLPSHFPGRNTFWILTIHDLNFLQEKNPHKANKYLKRIQKNIDRADCITTISNYSKGLIEQHLNLNGKEIHVIYNGIASNDYPTMVKPDFMGDGKFLFSIGIFNRKKNFHTLLPLMKSFENHQLILAGNHETSYGKEIMQEIKRLNLEKKVLLPGKISESDKYWLYNNCDALLFPSLAEGFGMPVIEAMKAGKPVFLSKYTSLPEIGDDAAFYFDSFEETNMVKVIQSGLDEFNRNPSFHINRIKKHAERFSWQTCMNNYLNLYKQFL